MITLITAGIAGGLILYALIIRILWRRQEKETGVMPRNFIFEFSPESAKAGETRALELATALEGLNLQTIGLAGELVKTPGTFLCPFYSLFFSAHQGVVHTWCGRSGDETKIAFVGEEAKPAFFMSAFDSGYVLITAVGEGESGSESIYSRQYAPSLAEASLLHEETVGSWEAGGHTPLRDLQRTWSMAEATMAEFFHPSPTAFEKEHYFQKSVFIFGGAALSFGLGVFLALWL